MSERRAALSVAVVDGIARIEIDNPPVNALSADVLSALAQEHQALNQDSSVRAVILSGARGTFIAGADISRLERIAQGQSPDTGGKAPVLGELISAIEASPKPWVAAIDGFALGGGLEVALGCHGRVGTARARLGLPELKLGLIPGAGGTQRLPRLIGAAAALDAMLSGNPLIGTRAHELGLLDELVDPEQLLDRACARAASLAAAPPPPPTTLARPLESEAAERAAERAREQHEKRFKNVDHPEACLEAVLTGVREGAAAGLARERALFTELLTKPAARGLIHLFFAERAAAKVPGVTDQKRQGRPIERVGVLGGGTMGTGIATALLTAGFSVQLVEADIDRAQAARSRIEGLLARAEHKGRASAEQTEQRRRALSVADDLSAVFDADFVIEAATEERALKRRLFSELLEHTPADVTLASNTSTIDIDEIADGTERVVGMHFFSPAHVMRLCEVVRGTRSSDDRLRDTLWLAKRLGKVAVTVRSCPGFLVNRVFMPYSQATGLLIDRGIDPYRIDAVLEAFGMPMGPCKMSDLAGIDVGLLAGAVLDQAYADRAYRSPLRRILVDAGRLGQKTGAGHYRYVDGRAQQDPELSRFVAEARQEAGAPAPVELSDEQIVDALILGVVNEASRALSEDVVQRAGDVDVAAALGMGFPAYRGGPMFWAQQRGTEAIKRTSSALAERFDHPLFVPTG